LVWRAQPQGVPQFISKIPLLKLEHQGQGIVMGINLNIPFAAGILVYPALFEKLERFEPARLGWDMDNFRQKAVYAVLYGAGLYSRHFLFPRKFHYTLKIRQGKSDKARLCIAGVYLAQVNAEKPQFPQSHVVGAYLIEDIPLFYQTVLSQHNSSPPIRRISHTTPYVNIKCIL